MVNVRDIQVRDPFILEEEGKYYMYGTTDKEIWYSQAVGLDVYVAKDENMEEFDGPYHAFRPDDNFYSKKNFWAPEVYKYNGMYYMFATFWHNEEQRGTSVLVADNPLGPFSPWSDGLVTPMEWCCLDGTLYVEDGQPFMVFCHEWKQIEDGSICSMPLSEDLKNAIAMPTTLFHASEAPWAHERPFKLPGMYVTDGPFMYYDKGELFMLWSSFSEGKYAIGISKSSNGRLDGKWIHSDAALYSKDGGHGMLFKKEAGLFLAIHTPNDSPNERAIFIEIRRSKEAVHEKTHGFYCVGND